MKTSKALSVLFGGMLFIGSASTAISQTDSQDHDAHHPTESQAAPAAPTGGATPPAGMQGGMPGTGMMKPEMMQMMQRMMSQSDMPGAMGGMQGGGTPGGAMGRSMMGQGMMGQTGGMMMCPMMRMMMTGQAGTGMPSVMGGQGILLGTPLGSPEEMTQDRVRTLLEQQLTSLGNPRLRLGVLDTNRDGSITAEIVTVEGSLVQKLAFNRYPGLVRQID